jgi:hypothetical protein
LDHRVHKVYRVHKELNLTSQVIKERPVHQDHKAIKVLQVLMEPRALKDQLVRPGQKVCKVSLDHQE